jgi:hypothetical protein
MIQDVLHRMYRARLGIVRAIYQPPDAGVHHRAGAHGARFNCNKQIAVFQTVVTKGSTGFAQRHDLGVGRGVRVADVAIPSAPDDPSIAYNDRSDGNLARIQRALGAAEGFFHP